MSEPIYIQIDDGTRLKIYEIFWNKNIIGVGVQYSDPEIQNAEWRTDQESGLIIPKKEIPGFIEALKSISTTTPTKEQP